MVGPNAPSEPGVYSGTLLDWRIISVEHGATESGNYKPHMLVSGELWQFMKLDDDDDSGFKVS